MKRLNFQHMMLSGTLILALGACAHKPSKAMKADTPFVASSPPVQQVILLQEARIESENLRAELASLKILMAKQAGELQSLRKQSKSVQHREQDQGLQLQQIRSQLLSSQAERDQLRKHNMELEGQVSSMPDTSQLVLDIQSLRGSFQQIMSNMKGLASDMQLIKQEMHITIKNTLKPQQTKMTTSLPSVNRVNKLAPDAKGRIIIQERDTLWKLSRTYQVSVEQLREWNNISSDLIMTGLHLQVAEPMKTIESQPENLKVATESSVSKPKNESLKTPVQNTSQQPMEPLAPNPSEPTHILSIASPESNSHELP
mgnify:CR=1 FL=1